MRVTPLVALFLLAGSSFAAKKVISPDTSAGNDQMDIEASLTMAKDDVVKELGADPGDGIVLLRVKITPRIDTPLQVSPDDFVLLAHNDGERSKPFAPAEIAGQGALIERTKDGAQSKKSVSGGVAGIMMEGGGGALSPGSSRPVTVGTQMDNKAHGNDSLLKILQTKAFPSTETLKPVEGYLYFALDGKHKLKDMAVLYRGPAGKLDLEFVH